MFGRRGAAANCLLISAIVMGSIATRGNYYFSSLWSTMSRQLVSVGETMFYNTRFLLPIPLYASTQYVKSAKIKFHRKIEVEIRYTVLHFLDLAITR